MEAVEREEMEESEEDDVIVSSVGDDTISASNNEKKREKVGSQKPDLERGIKRKPVLKFFSLFVENDHIR